MANKKPVFKSWAPEWLIRSVLFIILLPSMTLFGLSTASVAGAAGYYGIEPTDVQYSMVLFYAAVASFFALERRFFTYIATKEYFLISTALQILTSLVIYHSQNLFVIFVFRFLQGMSNCASTSIVITLIFGRLHSARAREIGYSVFYCVLLCISPFTTLVTAPLLNAFDFNVLYKCLIYAYVPGAILVTVLMNPVRLNRKFPLYQLDFASFLIYAVALCLIGYVLIYGQEYYWFEDTRVKLSAVAIAVLFALHIIRQRKLKRAYLSLDVFKYTNFRIGALLIFILYIIRGALGVTSSYFGAVMGMDPIHVGYILAANMVGVIFSVVVSSRLIVLKRPMRQVWLMGFSLLLVFHVWMLFLFNSQANASSYIIPLIVQGMGAGMVMAPIIVFMVSSVPTQLGTMASATGVFFRFTGFCSSIALVNYFQLYRQSEHYNRFLDNITDANPLVVQKMTAYRQLLISKGMAPANAARVANGLLNRSVAVQTQLRFAMDYYQMISWLILITILLIALYPYINRTIVNVRGSQPAPMSY